MKRLATLITITLLLLAAPCLAATYYVDTAADGDAGAGTSEAANVAWKTIAKVNASSFSAGDSILFKRGETWRGSLTVPSSGTNGSPITFGYYGASGAKPIIQWDGAVSGWSTAGSWTEVINPTTYFGQTATSGTDSNGSGQTWGNKGTAWTCPGTGNQTLIELSAYSKSAGGAAGTTYLAIYNAGNRSLVAKGSGAVTVSSTSWGWVGHVGAANLTPAGGSAGDPVTIVGGNTYLIVQSQSSSDVRCLTNAVTSGNAGVIYTDHHTGNFATTLETQNSNTAMFSLRAGIAGIASNQWTCALTAAPLGTRLWLNGVGYSPAATANTVDATNRWFWASGTLTVYATSNPAAFYANMDLTSLGTWASMTYDGPLHVSKDYVNFENLDLRSGWNSVEINGANHVDMNGVDFGKESFFGAYIRGSNTYINIHNSSYESGFVNTTATSELGGDGIATHGGLTNSKIYGNTIANAFHSGINFTGTSANEIQNNEVYLNDISCPNTNYGRGIELTGTAEDAVTANLVYRNYLHNLKTSALAVNGNHNKYYYNIINGVSTNPVTSTYNGGIYISYSPSKQGSDEEIYNNVVYNVANHGMWFQSAAGHVNANNLIKNNVFMNWGAAFNAINANDAYVGATVFLNNVFYKSGVTTNVIRWNGTDYTVADFEAASGAGWTATGNQNADPLFTTNGSDFHLQPTSPAKNAGVNPCTGANVPFVGCTGAGTGSWLDYAMAAVPQGAGVDMGAYEFDETVPTLQSATIGAAGNTLTLVFSEAVSKGAGYADADLDLDCSIAGNNVGVSYTSGDGTTTLVFGITGATAHTADTCNFDFTGDANSLEDGSGNDLAAIVSAAVTNNSTVTDTTPTAFSFTDVTGATRSTEYTSNTITVAGIDAAAAITVTGGTYSKNGGAFTANAGTVVVTDQVRVKVTSSANFSTAVNGALTIGGVSDTYTVTTLASDTTPTAFSFTDVTRALVSTVYTSNTITIAGINDAADITVTGGTYSKNGGAFTANAGTVDVGDEVQVRATSSADKKTAVNAVLTIGGVADTYTVTTRGASGGGLLPLWLNLQ